MTKKQFAKTIESVTAVLTGTYLFASFPGFKKKKKWQHLLRWDYAHRGLHRHRHGRGAELPPAELVRERKEVGESQQLERLFRRDDAHHERPRRHGAQRI